MKATRSETGTQEHVVVEDTSALKTCLSKSTIKEGLVFAGTIKSKMIKKDNSTSDVLNVCNIVFETLETL